MICICVFNAQNTILKLLTSPITSSSNISLLIQYEGCCLALDHLSFNTQREQINFCRGQSTEWFGKPCELSLCARLALADRWCGSGWHRGRGLATPCSLCFWTESPFFSAMRQWCSPLMHLADRVCFTAFCQVLDNANYKCVSYYCTTWLRLYKIYKRNRNALMSVNKWRFVVGSIFLFFRPICLKDNSNWPHRGLSFSETQKYRPI